MATESTRIMVFGATGTIGKLLCTELEGKEGVEIIKVSRSGDVKIDANSEESIKAGFEAVGKVDHIVFVAGGGGFGPVAEMETERLWEIMSLKFKCQAAVTLIGQKYLNPGGSIILTSGILDREPIAGSVAISAANAALAGFVASVANEFTEGRRCNLVSPGLLEESAAAYGPYFPGFVPVAGSKVVQAYIRLIYSGQTGRKLEVFM